ncbi:MATE family efflux transporter [Luteococcus sp. Sow4_B9]|uniref:MATE family efflux transporter n=1 Tax=Luteococcus sp. Sow4_B9 TaxID=3438792 RepID=UPI003F955DAB
MAKNLTTGSPIRLIVLFTLPLLVGNVFQQAYAVVDTIVVGRLIGVQALAAVGASGSLQFLLMGFAMGCSAGMAIPVSRHFGAGDLRQMRQAVAAGVIISTGVALAITLVGVLGAPTMLRLLGTPAELVPEATTFLRVFFGGAAATVGFNYLSSVIRALGDSTTPLVFLIIASVLNVVLVLAFIGGLGMGVGGAALATVLAQLVSVLLCMVLVWRRMPELHLTRADFVVGPVQLRESARQGFTLGFQMSIIAIGAALLQFGINGLGSTAVAAFTTAMRVDQMAVIPLMSTGVAMATFVAQNAGALQWRRILDGVRQALLLSVGMSLVLGALIFAFGTSLVEVFVGANQPEVVALAHQYLVVNAALYAILSVLFVIRHSIQGLGSTTAPTAAGVLELVARGVVGLFLVERIGFLGVVIAAPAAWTLALVPLLLAWRVHRRLLKQREQDAFQPQVTPVA